MLGKGVYLKTNKRILNEGAADTESADVFLQSKTDVVEKENYKLPGGRYLKEVPIKSIIKSLSHQGGVLTVIPQRPKNAERRGARSTNASITAATQWHRHWTQWDRKERRGTACTLSILKTNTVARRPNRAQRGHRKVTIAAQ